jgi:hypothetical protein
VKAKNNLAPDTKAFAYNIGILDVGEDEETDQRIIAPHVLWHAQHVEVRANDAMKAEAGAGSAFSRDDAKKLLSEFLASGPVLGSTVNIAAVVVISRTAVSEATYQCDTSSERDPA